MVDKPRNSPGDTSPTGAGRPHFWLELRRARWPSGAPGTEAVAPSVPDASAPRVDCVRVAAGITGSGTSRSVSLGVVGDAGGVLDRLRRRGSLRLPMGEFVEGLDRTTGLAVTASDSGTALAVVGEARTLGLLERLWMTSTELDVLDAVRADSPATRLLHVCDAAKQRSGPERHAADLRERGIEGVMMPCSVVSAGAVALMHRFGRIVGAQGAEHARMVRAGVASGADIVCGPSRSALAEALGP